VQATIATLNITVLFHRH